MAEPDLTMLRQAVEAASARVDEAVRRLAPKHVGGELEAYEAAFQKLMLAERNLAAAEGRPYAVLQECPLQWDVGAPIPTLLQSDNQTFLFFLLSQEEQRVGVLEFDLCSSTSFGSPGDETFEGHPLHGSGFEPYRAMRVVNSPWIVQLAQIDSVHARHDPDAYVEANHFIFPFHDTTFECVARSFAASKVDGRLPHVVKGVVDRLF
jgi:hypothetical protein